VLDFGIEDVVFDAPVGEFPVDAGGAGDVVEQDPAVGDAVDEVVEDGGEVSLAIDEAVAEHLSGSNGLPASMAARLCVR